MNHDGIDVVREDLLEGGSKTRFLPYLIKGAKEVVYGGPFCGAAAFALSVLGRRLKIKVTLFYAARKPRNWHRNQRAAKKNGATIYLVPLGFMTNVQAKAKAYARERGARFLPLGFDVPQAAEPYIEVLRNVRRRLGSPDQVWCATGSGMLVRCLGVAFPESLVTGVSVGLASRHDKQAFTPNVRLGRLRLFFRRAGQDAAAFPLKPGIRCQGVGAIRSGAQRPNAFWNVL